MEVAARFARQSKRGESPIPSRASRAGYSTSLTLPSLKVTFMPL